MDLFSSRVGRVEGDVDSTGAFSCRRICVGFAMVRFSKDFLGTSNGFFKQRFQCSWGVASVAKSVEEEFNLGDKIR